MDWLSDINTLVGIVSGSIAIYSVITAWKKKRKKNELINKSAKYPAQRFLALFESHGVSRSQISGFFGHGLTIADCSDPDRLIEKLTEEILHDASELFGINLEWLHGASEEIFKVHRFYKTPEKCVHFFSRLKATGNKLSGYALRPDKLLSIDGYDSVIVIIEDVGLINGKKIKKLHVLGGWVHSYWKSRGYYAACASIAMNNDVWLIGKTCEHKWLSKFSSGEVLPEFDFESDSFNFELSGIWHVDEFLEEPKEYLKGVFPEENNFGLHAAIELWLSLEEEGYMSIDRYPDKTQTRSVFENYDFSE